MPFVILCSASDSVAFARKLWFFQVCSAGRPDPDPCHPDHDPHHTDPDPRHPDQCLLCVRQHLMCIRTIIWESTTASTSPETCQWVGSDVVKHRVLFCRDLYRNVSETKSTPCWSLPAPTSCSHSLLEKNCICIFDTKYQLYFGILVRVVWIQSRGSRIVYSSTGSGVFALVMLRSLLHLVGSQVFCWRINLFLVQFTV